MNDAYLRSRAPILSEIFNRLTEISTSMEARGERLNALAVRAGRNALQAAQSEIAQDRAFWRNAVKGVITAYLLWRGEHDK